MCVKTSVSLKGATCRLSETPDWGWGVAWSLLPSIFGLLPLVTQRTMQQRMFIPCWTQINSSKQFHTVIGEPQNLPFMHFSLITLVFSLTSLDVCLGSRWNDVQISINLNIINQFWICGVWSTHLGCVHTGWEEDWWLAERCWPTQMGTAHMTDSLRKADLVWSDSLSGSNWYF